MLQNQYESHFTFLCLYLYFSGISMVFLSGMDSSGPHAFHLVAFTGPAPLVCHT